MANPDRVALGMDIGGTATRVLIVDAEGNRRGAGRSGGGNPTAHGRQVWADAMSAALRQALAQSGPVNVDSVAVGLAGGGALTDGDVAAHLERVIGTEARYGHRIRVTGDVTVAFAAGTPEPDGTALVAGTGAVAAAIRDRAPARTVDGHGWLLGDSGSGFWIGRRAVRAVLAELDGRGPATELRPLVAEALLGPHSPEAGARVTCAQIIHAVHSRAPVDLAKLAPVVSRCAEAGDEVACGIAGKAVSHLMSAVEAVRSPAETTPIVVTGGIAAGDHMIAAQTRRQLEARWAGRVHPVHEGVAGATWLALAALPGVDEPTAARLHRLVTQSTDP